MSKQVVALMTLAAAYLVSLDLAWGQDASASAAGEVAAVRQMAAKSACASHSWRDRGRAPGSYIEGMALVYARAVCRPHEPETEAVSAAVDPAHRPDDALAVYSSIFAAAGMRNDKAGVDTLRHSYVLLIGLGMMESSGQFCEGRDVSQCFTSADSAEAGLFQTSYGVRTASPVLGDLFRHYSADRDHCLLDVFQGSLTCKIRKSHNTECPSDTSDVAGTGPGADWQALTKSCPAFATEYGAVVLRKHGGLKGEFNPIRKKQAEVRPECDTMLQGVEAYVAQHPDLCSKI